MRQHSFLFALTFAVGALTVACAGKTATSETHDSGTSNSTNAPHPDAAGSGTGKDASGGGSCGNPGQPCCKTGCNYEVTCNASGMCVLGDDGCVRDPTACGVPDCDASCTACTGVDNCGNPCASAGYCGSGNPCPSGDSCGTADATTPCTPTWCSYDTCRNNCGNGCGGATCGP